MQLIGIPKGEEREKQTKAFSRNNGSIFSKFDQNDKLMDPLFLHYAISQKLHIGYLKIQQRNFKPIELTWRLSHTRPCSNSFTGSKPHNPHSLSREEL